MARGIFNYPILVHLLKYAIRVNLSVCPSVKAIVSSEPEALDMALEK